MRKLLLLIVSLMLVGGSLAATLGTIQLRNLELRGYVDPTKDQNIPFSVPRPGVNVALLQYDQATLVANLERIRMAGFRWIRQFAFWDEIEGQQGEYDWEGWDRLVASFKDFPELEPVVVLMNSPEWARRIDAASSNSTRTAPPLSAADFAAFARKFSNRYGDIIDYYQIWDEPNLGDAWGKADPRPAQYVALLSAARNAILGADPTATIVAAGLAPTTETAGRNISDIRYLESMYAHGARDFMDVVAGKPFGFSSSPLDRRVDESMLNFSRIVAFREVMVANGDGRKPLWASGYGWNALPPDWEGAPSIWGEVTESERVQNTLKSLDRVYRELPWLGAMFLHHWQPAAAADSPEWGFALVQHDGSPSLLLLALNDHQYPDRAQNGLYHARNENARYSGVWQFSELGADIGWQAQTDSQLAFDFFGTDVAMLLREDDYVAFLYPRVDGKSANATQKDSSGNSYIFLRSNSRGPEQNLVSISAGLPLEPHTLEVVADQGWDRWAIAGYAVSSGDLATPYDVQIALGILTTCLSLAVLVVSMAMAPWIDWLPGLAIFLSRFNATTQLVLTGVTSIFMMLAMLWTWDSPKASIFMRDEVNIGLVLVTAGTLYLSPSIVLTILLGLVLFVQIYHRLENGLLLTLIWSPFFLFVLKLYSYAIPMVEVIILISAAAGFFKLMVILGRQLQLGNSGFPILPSLLLSRVRTMDIAVIGMALLGVLSMLWAQRPEMATTELRTLIVEPLLFYLLLRFARPDRGALCRLFAALILAAVLVCLIGLHSYFFDGSLVRAVKGVYGSPNNVGLLLDRTIPLALAFMLVDVDRRLRWLSGFSLIIMVPLLLLTQSVGAIVLGVPAGIVTVVFARYGRMMIAPILAVGVSAVAGVTLLTRLSAGFAEILVSNSRTYFVRLRLWESTLSIIREHPLAGIGLDQFLYHYGGEYLRPDMIWDRNLSHPHNFILDFWTRLSFFGVAVFLLLQYCFWRSAYSVTQRIRQRDPLLFAMAIGLMGSMAALLAHGLVDNSVFVIDLAFIFMFQLAAMTRLDALSQQPEM